jgi:hypothetical protein
LDDGYLYIGDQNDDPETNPIQVFWDSALTIPATQPIRTNSGYAWRNGTPGLLYTAGPFSITIRNKRNEFVLYSPLGYGFDPASVSASVVKNDFVGDGVDTTFTLSATPSTVLATNAFINGVYQEKDSYSLFGNVITFSVAPPLGSSIEIMTNETGVINSGNATAISYTLTAAGAVAQTVQTKLEQYVSVKDFGAAGDGVTDDTAAIQAALNASVLVGGSGASYAISSPLTVGASSCLQDIKLVALTPGMNMVLVNSNSQIQRVTLEGTGTTSIVERGVYPAVDGASDVVISDIEISNLTFGIHAQPLTSLTPARWRISGYIHDIVGTIGASEGYGVLLSPAVQCEVNAQFKNIRRHAVYLSAGASQNYVQSDVDGCGNYATQIFSSSLQPASEGNVIRGSYRNLTEDAPNQVGAVAIIAKANYNDVSITMNGGGAKKGVWIEGTGTAIGPYPTGNSVHDCSFFGSYTDTVITALYAANTMIHNNRITASFTTAAISLSSNATTTFTFGGDVQGNVIDGLGTSFRGITNSCECQVFIGNNRVANVTGDRVRDFSVAQQRLGFNVSCSGFATATAVPSLNTKNVTVTLPYVFENPIVQATVNGGTVSSINVPLTCIALMPSGSPMTFDIRTYNGAGSSQDIKVFWTVYGD